MAQAPDFWWHKPGWQAQLLKPAAWIYGQVAGNKLRRNIAPKVALPVLCIGNYTVGGAGKTPTAIALVHSARKLGLRPGIVSRGYGGSFKGSHRVDISKDSAAFVGDEPLLLSQHAAVVVGADRHKGANMLRDEGCNFIIMDDGFQSARLFADYSLLVVDAMRGIGNGLVLPAGPLRAPLEDQIRKTDAILRIGKANTDDAAFQQGARAGKPILNASLKPCSPIDISKINWLAFAGIGNPEKFYLSVQELGGQIAVKRSFADHYNYTNADIEKLWQEARRQSLGLITTAKDMVRLNTMPDINVDLLAQIVATDVVLCFENADAADALIQATCQNFQQRI